MFYWTRVFNCAIALALLVNLYISDNALAQDITNCSDAKSTEYVNSYGESFIQEDETSRYVYQYMYWHDISRLHWFRLPYAPGENFSAGTWELDTFFYNYDGHAYGNEPTGYWDSDLPYPYVDTQAFDSSDEKAVTIGSAHAFDIQPSRYYYYITRMTDGGFIKLGKTPSSARVETTYILFQYILFFWVLNSKQS